MPEKPTYEELERRIKTLEKQVQSHGKTDQSTQITGEMYQNLFDNAQVGMWRSKLDGSAILAANQKLADIFECSIEELLAKPAIIRWADPKARDVMQQKIKETGHLIDYEVVNAMWVAGKMGRISAEARHAAVKNFPKSFPLMGDPNLTFRKKIS